MGTEGESWSAAQVGDWDHLQLAMRAWFARVGIEWDDMLAPDFTGPRHEREPQGTITKPSERSMWVDPVFYSRAFRRRDDLCFVVMPFRDDRLAFYESAVKPLVEELGLTCELASDITAGHGDLMDEVWVALNESRLVIADLTGQNANVYELGIAHTLGNQVIAISMRGQPAEEGRLAFDVSGRRTILYENTAPGGEAFKRELRRHLTTILESRA